MAGLVPAPSTSSYKALEEDVEARHKAGPDECWEGLRLRALSTDFPTSPSFGVPQREFRFVGMPGAGEMTTPAKPLHVATVGGHPLRLPSFSSCCCRVAVVAPCAACGRDRALGKNT